MSYGKNFFRFWFEENRQYNYCIFHIQIFKNGLDSFELQTYRMDNESLEKISGSWYLEIRTSHFETVKFAAKLFDQIKFLEKGVMPVFQLLRKMGFTLGDFEVMDGMKKIAVTLPDLQNGDEFKVFEYGKYRDYECHKWGEVAAKDEKAVDKHIKRNHNLEEETYKNLIGYYNAHNINKMLEIAPFIKYM